MVRLFSWVVKVHILKYSQQRKVVIKSDGQGVMGAALVVTPEFLTLALAPRAVVATSIGMQQVKHAILQACNLSTSPQPHQPCRALGCDLLVSLNDDSLSVHKVSHA